MANSKDPIGIFDSGVGGLTVASAINRLLPEESFIYFGDTRHAPYGDKSKGTILDYSRRISRFLVESGCKAIVIACNSASAMAYRELRKEWPQVPILNVVDPVVEEVLKLNARKVGLVATRATVRSKVYANRLQSLEPQLKVVQKATPLLAPLVEEGFAGTEVSKGVLTHYLNDVALKDLSHLILGCTHYPLLQNEFEEYLGSQVQVLNSADLVAEALKKLLDEHALRNSPSAIAKQQFFVSEKTPAFKATARLFFGKDIKLEERLLPA
jgi:glutamate racemase